MEKQRVTVLVAGQKFTLITDEDEKYVMDVAAKIDARITSIAMSQNMTRERAAVLTALDVADDNERIKRDTADVKEQIKDYISALSDLQQQNAALNEEIASLKTALSEIRHAATSSAPIEAEAAPAPDTDTLDAAVLIPDDSDVPARESEPIPEITADDDLPFDEPVEAPVIRPKKKPRHEHKHENPYREQAKKQEQKGYTPQRQYSLFDLND